VKRLATGLAAVALALCPGCTPTGAVFLTIDAVGPDGALTAPDEVDQVTVVVTGAGDKERKNELLNKVYPLGETHRFPLTLGVDPSKTTPGQIRFTVTLSLKENPIGGAEAVATLKGGEVTQATVRIVVE
jgi:hypothetical protein